MPGQRLSAASRAPHFAGSFCLPAASAQSLAVRARTEQTVGRGPSRELLRFLLFPLPAVNRVFRKKLLHGPQETVTGTGAASVRSLPCFTVSSHLYSGVWDHVCPKAHQRRPAEARSSAVSERSHLASHEGQVRESLLVLPSHSPFRSGKPWKARAAGQEGSVSESGRWPGTQRASVLRDQWQASSPHVNTCG